MNLISNSSLFKLLLFCFLCLRLVNCEDDQTCIMSDTCGFGNNGPVPCAQTSSPIKFTDEKDLKLLNEMCPSLKGKKSFHLIMTHVFYLKFLFVFQI